MVNVLVRFEWCLLCTVVLSFLKTFVRAYE